MPGRVRVADVNPLSPAVHLTDRWHTVPLSTDPGYIDAILDICRADNIQLVVPTIDDELVLFGQARARFKAWGAGGRLATADQRDVQ